MGDPITRLYQFICDKNNIDEMKTIQYFLINGLVLFIKVYSYVEHMLYVQSFSNKTEVTINIKKKIFHLLNTKNTVFSWGDYNSNKNTT